jgi:uncharacterized protein YneF (UPF0154 family)
MEINIKVIPIACLALFIAVGAFADNKTINKQLAIKAGLTSLEKAVQGMLQR